MSGGRLGAGHRESADAVGVSELRLVGLVQAVLRQRCTVIGFRIAFGFDGDRSFQDLQLTVFIRDVISRCHISTG